MGNPAWQILDSKGKTISTPAMSRKRKMLAAYKGAAESRNQADWSAGRGSPDSTLLPERWQLIHRIRERLRNDPVMRGCLKKLTDSVIGPKGFSTQSQLDHERLGISEEQARSIERDIDFEWSEWQRECDYAGNPARSFTFASILSTLFQTEIAAGETFIIPRYIPRPWARFSFCLQVIAPDRVAHPNGFLRGTQVMQPHDGADIRDGIRIGPRGEVQGMYVAREHPYNSMLTRSSFETDYIPAYNRKTRRANFWHNYQLYRPEATRGEPAFAACLLGFKSLGDYVSDELIRAHMATMFGLAVTREEAFDPDSEGLAEADKFGSTDEREESQISLHSGMINYFDPGDKVEVVNPNIPGPQFDSFTDKIATWAGGPLGLAREQVLNTYNGMSYSSAQCSRDEAQRGHRRWQDDIVESYIEPPRERVIEEAVLRGRLRLPGWENPAIRRLYFAHTTFPPAWPHLDPVKEANGAKLRLEAGTSTLTLECAARGHSFRSIVRQRQREKQELEKAGLPLPEYLRDAPIEINSPPQAPQDGEPDEDATEE